MNRRYPFAVLPLLVGASLLLSGCDKAPPPEEKPRPVKLVTVGAASVQGQVELAGEIRARTEHVTALVEELNSQRAEERIGEEVVVLVESIDVDGIVGRAAHQGPEVDGTTTLLGAGGAKVGDLLTATVSATDGVDLVARVERERA